MRIREGVCHFTQSPELSQEPVLGLDAHRVPDPLLLSWSPRGFQLDFLEHPVAIRTLTAFHIRFPKGLWGLATNPPSFPSPARQVLSVTGHRHLTLPLPTLSALVLSFSVSSWAVSGGPSSEARVP